MTTYYTVEVEGKSSGSGRNKTAGPLEYARFDTQEEAQEAVSKNKLRDDLETITYCEMEGYIETEGKNKGLGAVRVKALTVWAKESKGWVAN